jgi:hypothetical protein
VTHDPFLHPLSNANANPPTVAREQELRRRSLATWAESAEVWALLDAARAERDEARAELSSLQPGWEAMCVWNERLKAEVSHWRSNHDSQVGRKQAAKAERDALAIHAEAAEAEAATLREALERIAGERMRFHPIAGYQFEIDVGMIARAALGRVAR